MIARDMDVQKQPIFLLFVLIHICPIQIDKPIMYIILYDKKPTVFSPESRNSKIFLCWHKQDVEDHFSLIFSRSLSVLTWKTGKKRGNFSGSQIYDAKHWAIILNSCSHKMKWILYGIFFHGSLTLVTIPLKNT